MLINKMYVLNMFYLMKTLSMIITKKIFKFKSNYFCFNFIFSLTNINFPAISFTWLTLFRRGLQWLVSCYFGSVLTFSTIYGQVVQFATEKKTKSLRFDMFLKFKQQTSVHKSQIFLYLYILHVSSVHVYHQWWFLLWHHHPMCW